MPGSNKRIVRLCQALEHRNCKFAELRYQLFHRTAAAIFEAERYRARHAMMMVHSFSTSDASLNDFLRFAETMKMPIAGKGRDLRAEALGVTSSGEGPSYRAGDPDVVRLFSEYGKWPF
jgi:hypothetical protein